MPQSFAGVYLHLIFSTKNRECSIRTEWAPRLYEYIGGILRDRKCQLLAAGGVEDHVHLLVSLSREITLSSLVRDIKSVSSHWVHQNMTGSQEFAWQQGYAVFSVSQSALVHVKKRTSVAPLGLDVYFRLVTRGCRPWLLSAGPLGLGNGCEALIAD
ncbi:IS200/IS605 family transposase [Blastopirellula marina]|uniref:Transposase n=1 Tax=Blastopirellula marina TaxID=124 RepID=A0A2S8GPR4_9BACT|nr:IS200/IS605 family transposase [Blastopirellula marina]PQO46341.1 transposase [Blastopirellula marina]